MRSIPMSILEYLDCFFSRMQARNARKNFLVSVVMKETGNSTAYENSGRAMVSAQKYRPFS